MIVCDDNVKPLYLEEITGILVSGGYEVFSYVFSNGENAKCESVLFDLMESLANNGFKRDDLIAALGGGVAGDIAGFAASIYMRGIDFIQIPTTLLAAVDSSVGGKTAVNLKMGKNLAGTFWQPSLVLCDLRFLESLSREDFLCGCGEVIKYGVAFDAGLFEKLENGILEDDLEWVIKRCVEIKRDVIESDEYDRDSRAKLNFGHTIGHAIEKVSGYSVMHGQAVCIGMVMMSTAAYKAGMSEDINARLVPLLKKLGLPYACKYSAAQLSKAALSDKKTDHDGITLVLPKKIGESYLYHATSYELIKMIELGGN